MPRERLSLLQERVGVGGEGELVMVEGEIRHGVVVVDLFKHQQDKSVEILGKEGTAKRKDELMNKRDFCTNNTPVSITDEYNMSKGRASTRGGGGVQYNSMGSTVSEYWDSDVVVGKCTAYCPARELKLRVRERLLSRYEVGGAGVRPVKEYSRPAAGQAAPSSDTVRTPDTLMNCVIYLVRDVVVPRLSIKEELLELYDFVFDRLRGVRQDMTVQRMEGTVCMDILSICVR